MEKIKVNKEALLNVLKQNLKQHLEDYELAVEGYKIIAKKELQKKLKELKNLKNEDIKNFELYIHAQKPECHKNDFSIAIGMLELSVENEIYIDSQQYKQYYLNDWVWKESWYFSNTSYMGAAGPTGSSGSKGSKGIKK